MNPQPTDPILLNDSHPLWFDLLTFAPMLIVLLVTLWFWRQGYTGFRHLKKQWDFLDHQKNATAKTLEQNKTFEEMIAKQYAESNERADRALAQSDDAIRLHAAALEQLARMNDTLARVALKIEAGGGQGQPGATAS